VVVHQLTGLQDWLYEDGEDASKAQYIAKMDEINFVAGPVIQRYNDKQEEERQKVLKAQEEAAAKKRAELEAKKKADDEAKKAEEAKNAPEPKDTEMTDANGETVKPDGVEEK
jgi:heat shock 70kDa protein 4